MCDETVLKVGVDAIFIDLGQHRWRTWGTNICILWKIWILLYKIKTHTSIKHTDYTSMYIYVNVIVLRINVTYIGGHYNTRVSLNNADPWIFVRTHNLYFYQFKSSVIIFFVYVKHILAAIKPAYTRVTEFVL